MTMIQTSPECGCCVDNSWSEIEAFTEAIKDPAIRKEIIEVLEGAGLLPL